MGYELGFIGLGRIGWFSKWWVRWIGDPKRMDLKSKWSSGVGIRVT